MPARGHEPVLVDFWVADPYGTDPNNCSINDHWTALTDDYYGIASIGGGYITHTLASGGTLVYHKDTTGDKITLAYTPST